MGKKKVYYINFNVKPLEVKSGYVDSRVSLAKDCEVLIEHKGIKEKIISRNVYYIKEDAEENLREYQAIKKFKATHEHICKYCGKFIIDKTELTVDHIIPKSKGGRTEDKNLVIACEKCNKDKSSEDAFKYINCKVKSQMKKESLTRRACKKIGRNINLNSDNVEYLAKHDSNVWDLKTFFTKNPYKIADEVGC